MSSRIPDGTRERDFERERHVPPPPDADTGLGAYQRTRHRTPPQPNQQFPTRRSYFVLALAFIAFALYGSLLPFDLRPVPLAAAWDDFQARMLVPARVSRSDLLANILLFVPVGFALAGSVLVDRAPRLIRATMLILPVSFAISVLAEFLQTFVSGRISSNVDIASQLVGCLIGIAGWAVIGSTLTGWVRNSLSASSEHRLSRVLTAFAAAWVFVNLAPFDITVDVGDLAQRVRSGKITLVPFSDAGLTGARRVWDYVAETIAAAPLGVLGLVGFSQRRRRTAAAAFGIGVVFVVLIEMAHVFIRSHAADITDAILGSCGVAIGVWIGTRMLPRAGAALVVPSTSSTVAPQAAVVLVIWCLVLALYHWLPYDFVIDGDAIREKFGRLSLLPFAGYAGGSYLSAFNDLLVKLALAVPLGLTGAFVVPSPRRPTGLGTAAWIGVAACIFAGIEGGQFFLPRRIPDPTDVLVGVVGAYAGLLLGQWLQHGKR